MKKLVSLPLTHRSLRCPAISFRYQVIVYLASLLQLVVCPFLLARDLFNHLTASHPAAVTGGNGDKCDSSAEASLVGQTPAIHLP